MTLAAGTRLGTYEIVEPLGAGGMGEVYRARDTKLHRDVAIKILPGLFAGDPERKVRFEREAQLLASLNHANIAQIYGVEESNGISALVMELVDGPTLAEALDQQKASHATGGSHRSRRDDIDALAIARQIAEALEAAHERGIIHRDLKPQNIKLRPDGMVKVLDFGLAKALDPVLTDAPANSPTITDVHTRVGTLLGTAAYMAPEQIKGRAADRRADVWAFGVVLYELVTGSAPFHGETTSEILARVIEREPDWSKVPSKTPPAIVRLLERTLVKDPKRRLQSIGDARLEIEEALASSAARPEPGKSGSPLHTRLWLIPAVAASLLAVGVLAGRMTPSRSTIQRVPAIRASIALPEGLYLDGVGPPELSLSRDGRTLAFVARGATGLQRLYVRALDSETATLVPDSETVEGPFFSPDGRWIAFAVGVSAASGVLGGVRPELRKYSLDTGLTQTIATVDDYFGGVWLDDGSIVYVDRQPAGLWKIDAGAAKPYQIVPKFIVDGQEVERPVAWPSLLPGGRSLLVSDLSSGHLTVVELESRHATSLGIESAAGQMLPNGYLLYASPAASLVAVPFDGATMRPAGTATAIVPGIAFARNKMPVFAVSGNGTLVYATGYLRGSRREPRRLVRFPLSGAPVPLPFEPDLLFRGFALSPDGRQLTASSVDGPLWIYDLRRGTRVKLPIQALRSVHTLTWSPERGRLAIAGPLVGKSSWGFVVSSVDQPGRAEVLTESADSEIHVAGWTPDGKTIFGWGNITQLRSAIFRIDAGQPRQTIAVESGFVNSITASPDGRWLAYDLTAGSLELFVMPATGKGPRVPVTSRGGSSPRWSRDGRQLFFRRDNTLLAVDVDVVGDSINLGAERIVLKEDLGQDYDVAASGEFYAIQPVPGAGDQTAIQLKTGWFEEVERLMRRRAQ